jgi:hypothetical protein
MQTVRANRFPSFEERVKLYMSNWYAPPCPDDEVNFIRYRFTTNETWPILELKSLRNRTGEMRVESIISPDKLFYVDREILNHCATQILDGLLDGSQDSTKEQTSRNLEELSNRIEAPLNMKMYCYDVKALIFPALRHIDWENSFHNVTAPPTLLQFGDNKRSHSFGSVEVPHMKKFRSAATQQKDVTRVTTKECQTKHREVLNSVDGGGTFQPIIWKLATHRHYGYLSQIQMADTPWHQKKDMSVFRGQLTGSKDGGYDRHADDLQNCKNMIRCRLVLKYHNSKLVDAKLTSTRKRIRDVLADVPLVGAKIEVDGLLKYKALIMIEGNDVASGLKWALLSQSVVIMPPPKYTSWAMEELLQPWIHYIPLDDFATNIEERMQWVIDNDEEAQRIAERATLWMEDLVFHPDAQEDDRLIQEEIIRRYQTHFRQF